MNRKYYRMFLGQLNNDFRNAWQNQDDYSNMDVVDDLAMYCMM